ncbi:T9SS type A sorting domain-containing protein [Chryseobacterium nepalense]|uniref:T9SS type A sorting domain-containing protein n=1 Tax=Chryseobacterium nepalense TaxID=1854498 RepID=UPI002E048FE3|nr:hypothetical protein [Chryseobacterium nepalense]
MSLPLLGFVCGIFLTNAQCNPVSSLSENFDAYSCCNMGVVPACWDSVILGGASQIISSTQPASGTSQIYQTGYGTGKISIVILPGMSNLSDGTHRLRVKMKANGAGYLELGYIKDAIPDTFVVLQPITITNTSYDSTSERIFTIPTTIPAGMRLAIRNPGTSFAGHYWDDVVWEPIPNLGTNETDNLPKINLYPNPVHDELHVSNVKNVETLTLADTSGRILKIINNPSTTVSLSDLEKGMYFISLHFKKGGDASYKIIKD